MIDVFPRSGIIKIGKQGENRAIRVILPNIRAGSGSILLLHQRALDKKPYPVPVTESAEGIIWVVSSTDTANQGRGQAELQWLGENGEVVKSAIYQTETSRSLSAPGAVPDEPMKPYVQAVAKDAWAAKDAAASAAEAARSAEGSATQAGAAASNAADSLQRLEDGIASGNFRGEKGDKGDPGEKGEKGEKGDRGEIGPAGDTTAADAAAEAAKEAAQEAQKAAEASAGSAAQAAESVGGLADDLSTLKAENKALKTETARTARSLDYLWKKSKGIIYDTEIVTGAGSSVTVPSGAMEYAALRKLGGMSRNGYQMLIDDFPGTSAQISVAKIGRYSYAIETLNDGIYRQSGKVLSVSGVAGQYTVHARIAGKGGLIVRFFRVDGAKITEAQIGVDGTTRTVNVADNFTKVEIVFLGNTSASVPIGTRTEMSQIMLEASNTAHPWEPYADNLLDAPVDEVRVSEAVGDSTNTYFIPQAIRDLCPDYGQGTVDAYNYIDLTAKTYHHVGSMSQDGAWTALATPEVVDLSAVWPDD